MKSWWIDLSLMLYGDSDLQCKIIQPTEPLPSISQKSETVISQIQFFLFRQTMPCKLYGKTDNGMIFFVYTSKYVQHVYVIRVICTAEEQITREIHGKWFG